MTARNLHVQRRWGLGQDTVFDSSIPPVEPGYTRSIQDGVVVDTPTGSGYGASTIVWGSPGSNPTGNPLATVFGNVQMPGTIGSGANAQAGVTTGGSASGANQSVLFPGSGSGTGLGPSPGIPGLNLPSPNLPALGIPTGCQLLFGSSPTGLWICQNIFWIAVGLGALMLYAVVKR